MRPPSKQPNQELGARVTVPQSPGRRIRIHRLATRDATRRESRAGVREGSGRLTRGVPIPCAHFLAETAGRIRSCASARVPARVRVRPPRGPRRHAATPLVPSRRAPVRVPPREAPPRRRQPHGRGGPLLSGSSSVLRPQGTHRRARVHFVAHVPLHASGGG